MAKRLERKHRRAVSLAAILLLAAPLISGCSGLAPTKEEIQTEDNAAKYAQAMRMAANVRSGGDLATAAGFYQRAHALDPKQAEPLIGLAEAAAAAGAKDRAIEYLRQAMAVAPGNVSARRSYGTLLLTGGAPAQALETFRAAVERDPQDHRSYNGMGVALDLLGRQSEAQQVYRQGLKVAPVSASLRNNLALSLAISGDRQQARAMLEQLSADPGAGPRIRQNLALVYALDNDLQQAVAIASRDLSQAELRNNIALYRALPAMSPPEMASAVFGIGIKPGGDAAARIAAERTGETASVDEGNPLVRSGSAPSGLGTALEQVRPSAGERVTPLAAIPAAERGSETVAVVPAATGQVEGGEAPSPTSRRAGRVRKIEAAGGEGASPTAAGGDASPIVSFAGFEDTFAREPEPSATPTTGTPGSMTAKATAGAGGATAPHASPQADSAAASAVVPGGSSSPALEAPAQPRAEPASSPPAAAAVAAAAAAAVPAEIPVRPAPTATGPRTTSSGLQTSSGTLGGSGVIGGLGLSLVEPVAASPVAPRPQSETQGDTAGGLPSQPKSSPAVGTDPLLMPEPIGRRGL